MFVPLEASFVQFLQPSEQLASCWWRWCSPELGLDVAGTGGARLHLLLLLLPQDPLRQQVVGGCDVVVLVGLQGSGTTTRPSGERERSAGPEQ